MSFDDDVSRWRTMLAQADHLYGAENTGEALARAQRVADELAHAFTEDPRDREVLRNLRHYAEEIARTYRAAHDAWLAGVAARHEAFEDREARTYKSKTPGRLPE